jgi:hypothetical protein
MSTTGVEDRRSNGVPETGTHVRVREIIARATLVETDGERGVALVQIELCLEDGRRVTARQEDRLRVVVDLSNGLFDRAAVNTAVRSYVRAAIQDGTAARWPAFEALARFGASWQPGQDDAVISVGV